MRIWGVDPSLMCKAHLLGEHREMHALISMVRLGTKQKQLEAHCRLQQVAIHEIYDRHEVLAQEISRRGWNHKTPMSEEDKQLLYNDGSIDREANLKLLASRCETCRKLISASIKI